jgi:DNA-binding beta-propeller fold protein YncE
VQIRRPVAAAFLGQALCVANQRSGTISLVDLSGTRPVMEFPVGRHLTDLAAHPDGRHLLVVDDERHELVVLSCDGTKLSIQARRNVGPYPVSVAVLPGQRAAVASLWSRRLEVVDLAPLSSDAHPVTLRVLHTIRLPFAPRNQCLLPGGSLAVADAFSGHLAVVDPAAGRLVAVHEMTGHNLRGLAVSADGKHLLVSHQVLDQKAPTTRDNVERGRVMSNVVRSIPIDRLRSPHANLYTGSRLLQLGGAGDPAGIAVLGVDRIAVALAGVNEIALIGRDGETPRRVAAGCRPTAVVAGAGQPLVVVNTFEDSLSLLDARRGTLLRTISLGPQPMPSYRDRGEVLFHDARLSRGSSMSCHSCHTDGHTNGLLADTSGDGSFGTPKRTLTLLNTRLTDPWAWNGGMKYLHDQVEKSLLETMHVAVLKAEDVNDLVTFLHSLVPPPPLEPVTEEKEDREQVERGRRIFEERGCVHCHIPPLTYSSHGTHDVGFADERGLRQFNPPSLRGVGQGHGFLHDNRAATLEEVFTRFRHKVGSDMDPADLADLLRFLRSL